MNPDPDCPRCHGRGLVFSTDGGGVGMEPCACTQEVSATAAETLSEDSDSSPAALLERAQKAEQLLGRVGLVMDGMIAASRVMNDAVQHSVAVVESSQVSMSFDHWLAVCQAADAMNAAARHATEVPRISRRKLVRPVEESELLPGVRILP